MMQTRPIIVTDQDLQRLRELIREAKNARSERDGYFRPLEQELDHAQVVEPQQIPPDVITMNSTVRIREHGRKRSMKWTIVYPEDADMDDNRISILAPIGTALIGYREGDEVEWDVPAGRRRYLVEEVMHQPEAAGEFDR